MKDHGRNKNRRAAELYRAKLDRESDWLHSFEIVSSGTSGIISLNLHQIKKKEELRSTNEITMNMSMTLNIVFFITCSTCLVPDRHRPFPVFCMGQTPPGLPPKGWDDFMAASAQKPYPRRRHEKGDAMGPCTAFNSLQLDINIRLLKNKRKSIKPSFSWRAPMR